MLAYENHEYANLFPVMNEDEMASLVTSMSNIGYDETMPIVLYENKILDGRNRYKASSIVGVEPNFINYDGDNPLEFVLRHNLVRRHLNESQRAVIASKLANMKHGGDRKSNQTANLPLDNVTQDKAAEMLNVSSRNIRNVNSIEKSAPELIEKIESGEMTINQAITETKRKEAIDNLENIESKEIKEINGVYDVIVIDPPWDMKKIERDVRVNQVEFDYPTMTDEEIKNIQLPMADDCHVWLWTTHKKLPFAFELLESWNLKYVCTFVWHKNGGFQPVGLPQYNSEFCLYARKGTPIFIDTKDLKVCFNAERKSHSEKPQEFYNMVNRVTGGRRIDMFNRRNIDGFDSWGNESQ